MKESSAANGTPLHGGQFVVIQAVSGERGEGSYVPNEDVINEGVEKIGTAFSLVEKKKRHVKRDSTGW